LPIDAAGPGVYDARLRSAACASYSTSNERITTMSITKVQRKNGRSAYAVRWVNKTGRRRSRRFDRKADAEKWEFEVRNRKQTGDLLAFDGATTAAQSTHNTSTATTCAAPCTATKHCANTWANRKRASKAVASSRRSGVDWSVGFGDGHIP